LQRCEALADELLAAIDQTRVLSSVLDGSTWNIFIIRLVGLAEVGGIGERDSALLAHPVNGRAGVEAARECDANSFVEREGLQNRAHGVIFHCTPLTGTGLPGVSKHLKVLQRAGLVNKDAD
jgi:hypothetical protein